MSDNGRAELARRNDQPVEAYHCPDCGRFHVGHDGFVE